VWGGEGGTCAVGYIILFIECRMVAVRGNMNDKSNYESKDMSQSYFEASLLL
jgi:hypothetical protein